MTKKICLTAALWLGLFGASAQAQELVKQDSGYVMPDLDIQDSRIVERSGFKNQRVDSLTLEENRSADLGELLTLKTPIFIKRQGVGGVATPSFRGTGASHTQLYWNGINLNNPMLGQVDLSLFPVFLSDKVDVNFGASSLLYGTGGLGGAIRLESQPSWKKERAFSLNQSAGSFGTYSTSVGLRRASPLWNSVSKLYFKSAKNDFEFVNTSNGYVTERNSHAEQRQVGFLQEAHRKLGSSEQLSGRFWYQTNDRNLSRSMQTSSGRAQQEDDAWRALLEWQRNDPGKNLIVRGAWVRERIFFNDPDKSYRAGSESISTSYHLSGTFNFKLSESLYLNSGFSARHDRADTDNFRDSERKKVLRTENIQDAYCSLEGEITPRWTYSLLGRQQWIEGTAKPFLPSVGTSYQLVAGEAFGWSAKLNFSKNFHAPSLNDRYYEAMGNIDLKEEKGVNGELANQWVWKRGNWEIEYGLTAFYSKVRDWIIWKPVFNNIWRPENLRKVVSKGLENTLAYQFRNARWKCHLQLNYSYISSVNRENYDGEDDIIGEQLIYTPRHNFNGFLRLQYKKWLFNLEEYGYGKRNIRTKEKENDEHLAPYYLTNLSLGRTFESNAHRLDVRLKVSNLLGYHYQSVARKQMPTRYYGLTLAYRLRSL